VWKSTAEEGVVKRWQFLRSVARLRGQKPSSNAAHQRKVWKAVEEQISGVERKEGVLRVNTHNLDRFPFAF
jgi:hypothetical protein